MWVFTEFCCNLLFVLCSSVCLLHAYSRHAVETVPDTSHTHMEQSRLSEEWRYWELMTIYYLKFTFTATLLISLLFILYNIMSISIYECVLFLTFLIILFMFYYCFFVMFCPVAAVAHKFPRLWDKLILILCLFLFCSVCNAT